MPMTLSQFMAEMNEDVHAFEKWWLVEHAKNPEIFPLEFEAGNEGLWLEQFLGFLSMTEEERDGSTPQP